MDWTTTSKWVTHPAVQALLIVGAAWGIALIVDVFIKRVVSKLLARTKTQFDDKLIDVLRLPVERSILIEGIWLAILHLEPPAGVRYVAGGLLASWAVVLWTGASFNIVGMLLSYLSSNRDSFAAVNVRTLPVFEMLGKGFVVATCIYFLMKSWDWDLTGWIASAGIIGVAVGFGAKDSMANLFAGVFILADAPYKIGDFLRLDTGERGRVTDIGLRSTRMLTADEFEIIIPNAHMANAKIINESGGPQETERCACRVGVAYGSDIDKVREVLLDLAKTVPGVLQDDPRRKTQVHFTEMADSSLNFELRCWIGRPEQLAAVTDALNTAVYKRLQLEGIEIPYPKRDVYVHSQDTKTA
jgi:MscS family membrane protein